MRNLFCKNDWNLWDLSGEWKIRVDQSVDGVHNSWFTEAFDDDITVALPGTMDTHRLQPPETSGTLAGFCPVYAYKGAVWYQREIDIPATWHGKQFILYLERCQWETIVWVDGKCQGTRNSLVAPHIYDIADSLNPGRHRLTIMVDNTNRRQGLEGDLNNIIKHYDLTTDIYTNAKLNCGGHHIWSHNWIGILGRIELQVTGSIRLLNVNVYPSIKSGEIRVKVRLKNCVRAKYSVVLSAFCVPKGYVSNADSAIATWIVELTGEDEQTAENNLKLGDMVLLWDEFSPHLYELRIDLVSSHSDYKELNPAVQIMDTQLVVFGMRDLRTEGRRMLLNDRTIFLRGTLEDFVFPITGHPPMDVDSWKKVFGIAQSYGLNFFRFHSCCPPNAAFQAADELGVYLQVELPGTSCPSKDESQEVENFLSAELARILDCYGNHPSFLLMSMGNEQLIAWEHPEFLARHKAVLARKVRYGQTNDPRHLYTSTSHPYSPGRVDDFFVSAWPLSGDEPLCGIMWSGGRVIDCSRFNTRPFDTVFDYVPGIQGLDKPLVTHEVGQWSIYPDLREISRYHGAQRAFNFDIIRERLCTKGLLEWANDFTRASGMLALVLYKEEIESVLRTPGLSGFMLLDIHDYPGQGTSTVGILNSLWESKGLTAAAKFRAFCAPAVPLARLPKTVWTTRETLEATIDMANYGPAAVTSDIIWSLIGEDGGVHVQGTLNDATAHQGEVSRLGSITVSLDTIKAPARLKLRVEMAHVNTNSWDVWIYPDMLSGEPEAGIIISTKWDADTKAILRQGGRVLLVPSGVDLLNPIPGTFTPVFWNIQMKDDQPSKTMGIFCDPANPALANFPTEFHGNWQWWDIIMHSTILCLDSFPPALHPIVQMVDSFVVNRRLALVFEAKVGVGRLIVCSSDIVSNLDERPAARQLRKSLLDYMASPVFLPDVNVQEQVLDGLFKQP